MEEPRALARESAPSPLEDAHNDVALAEARLEAVLAELRVSPRAEKVAVSRAIEEALARLRDARSKLSTLRSGDR